MNFFTEELNRIINTNPWFDNKSVSYIGRQAYVKMPENRLAIIELRTHDTHDRYDMLQVSILDTRKQEIGKIGILFVDYIDSYVNEGGWEIKPHIWRGTSLEYVWYGKPPFEGLKKLSIAASDYIQLFW